MNVVCQKNPRTGRIVFLDVAQDYVEVASIEPWFSMGWLAMVGEEDPETVWDQVFGDVQAARQGVYAELIRRNCGISNSDEPDPNAS